MNRIVVAIVGVGVAGLGAYMLFFTPSARLKSATKQSLQQFSDAVATKDRAKIGAALSATLAEEARIKLVFDAVSITGQAVAPVTMEFDKPGFIAFLDRTLSGMSDYAYESRLESFVPAEDGQSGAVTFASKEWGDNTAMYGANSVAMRLSSKSRCEGTVAWQQGQARLSAASCQMTYGSVPKPGELQKMRDGIQEELLRQR